MLKQNSDHTSIVFNWIISHYNVLSFAWMNTYIMRVCRACFRVCLVADGIDIGVELFTGTLRVFSNHFCWIYFVFQSLNERNETNWIIETKSIFATLSLTKYTFVAYMRRTNIQRSGRRHTPQTDRREKRARILKRPNEDIPYFVRKIPENKSADYIYSTHT